MSQGHLTLVTLSNLGAAWPTFTATRAVPWPMCLSSTARKPGSPAALDRPSAPEGPLRTSPPQAAARPHAGETLPPARRNFGASANPSRVAPDLSAISPRSASSSVQHSIRSSSSRSRRMATCLSRRSPASRNEGHTTPRVRQLPSVTSRLVTRTRAEGPHGCDSARRPIPPPGRAVAVLFPGIDGMARAGIDVGIDGVAPDDSSPRQDGQRRQGQPIPHDPQGYDPCLGAWPPDADRITL